MNAIVPGFSHLLEKPHVVHALHDPERAWPQTNCSVDLLIELLAAYGFEPLWMLAFTVTQDFEGDHFTFFKVPSEDIEALYGISVQELAVWDDLQGHIVEQLQRGRLVLLEVDGYFLPDTRGVTYQLQHGKTTIGIYALDAEQRRLGYFHNETRGILCDADFDGALQRLPTQSGLLMPYTELLKPIAAAHENPAALAVQQLRRHWQRRPAQNPFRAYAEVFPEHIERLKVKGTAYFHGYAFNTLRQTGANFGFLDSFLTGLPGDDFTPAATCARSLADGAKTLQFQLARAVARNRFDALGAVVDNLAETYEKLMEELGRTAALAGFSPAATISH
jgi:hypothetical protein